MSVPRFAALCLISAVFSLAQAPRGISVPSRPGPAEKQSGAYYALVIGINRYGPSLPSLKTAVSDAQAIAAILGSRYGFQVKLLLDGNATRSNILNTLNQYRRSLQPSDSLLVYNAGHGYSDREAGKAYWLPADAEKDLNSNWIIADELTTDIRVQPARHVLIISDSCYSGGLTRDAGVDVRADDRGVYLRKMLAGKSRTLMASGGDEPVADGGAKGHSVFAGAVLRALERIDTDEFTAGDLFHNFVQQEVAGRSDQVPEYSYIRNSEHESGDFVFVRIAAGPRMPPPPAPTAPAASHSQVSGTWAQLKQSPPNVVALVTRGKTLVAGDGKAGVYRSTDEGAHWTPQTVPPRIAALALTRLPGVSSNAAVTRLVSCGPNLYAASAGRSGGTALFVSQDEGLTWKATALDGTSLAALGCADGKMLVSLYPNLETTGHMQPSLRGDPSETLLAMGKPYPRSQISGHDAVFTSRDAGNSWELSRRGFSATAVAVSDERLAMLGIDQVNKQADPFVRSYCSGAQEWTCVTLRSKYSIAAPVTFERQDAAIYVGTTMGSIMTSSNEGQTWRETLLPFPAESDAAKQGPAMPGLPAEVRTMVIANHRLIAGTRAGGVFALEQGSGDWSAIGDRILSGLYCLASDGASLYAGTTDGVYRIELSKQ